MRYPLRRNFLEINAPDRRHADSAHAGIDLRELGPALGLTLVERTLQDGRLIVRRHGDIAGHAE